MNMTDKDYVTGLKSNLHAVFDTPQGKEVMKWLEVTCSWYRSVWDAQSSDLTLIHDGRRQVLASVKTILELNPDQIVELSKRMEE
jgi:hypothetical protein